MSNPSPMTELTPQNSNGLSRSRDRIYWSLFISIVIADVVTKRWAEAELALHVPREVLGRWLRWTLTYNTGAAMNLSVGDASRIVFSAIAAGMLVYLYRLYRQTPAHERATPAALALISAGALGNLIDRVRHTKGVVDFIDVGTTGWRFWTFNVADMGVTIGAILLALLMWREGEPKPDHADAPSTSSEVPVP